MKTMTNTQNFIGMVGNTAITAVEIEGKEHFILTNNKVFKHFDFAQDFNTADEAFERARTINKFEQHFEKAITCYIEYNNHIYLSITDLCWFETYTYWLNNGILYGGNMETPTGIAGRATIYNLPFDANNCRNDINRIINKKDDIRKYQEKYSKDMNTIVKEVE